MLYNGIIRFTYLYTEATFTMFESIHLKNFKSFEDITLDLTEKYGKPKKMVLIFGANGVGKSNLASAFLMLAESLRTMDVRDIMQSILSKAPEVMNEETLSELIRSRYKDLNTLIKENKMIGSDSPMLIEIKIRIKEKSGRYIMEFDNDQLIHEQLDFVLEKNRRTYFDITPNSVKINPKLFQEKSAHTEILQACSKFWGKHSLLSIILHETNDKANNYIKSKLSENFQAILSFLIQISCKVKFGSIHESGGICVPQEILEDFEDGIISEKEEKKLDRTEQMLNAYFRYISKSTKRVYYKRSRKENRIHYQLMETKMIAGKERDLSFATESTGTQSLLQLLPYMLVVINPMTSDSVAIIDELDTGVHELLEKKIITALSKCITGQLIMTSHSTLLMESDIPKDCIYVINEAEDGSKTINTVTHYDKNMNENTNIRKRYLGGTYKSLPETPDIDFTNLLSTLKLDKH